VPPDEPVLIPPPDLPVAAGAFGVEDPVADEPVVVVDEPVVDRVVLPRVVETLSVPRVPARTLTLVDERPPSTATVPELRRLLTIVVLLSGADAVICVRLRFAYFFFFFTTVTEGDRSSDTVTC
jgi:hypothetical protein